MDDPRIASLRDLIEPLLADRGAELVELTCRPQRGVLQVCLLVEKVRGVNVQECATLNRVIGNAMDEAGIFSDSYTLEVSSPGLDRQLASMRDFERAVGEEIQVWIRDEKGIQDTEGQLLAVQADAIVLKTTAGNITISIAQIYKAKKAVKF